MNIPSKMVPLYKKKAECIKFKKQAVTSFTFLIDMYDSRWANQIM